MSTYPTNRKYTKEHEWTQSSGKIVTVGITDHAQSALGDIVYLDLPEKGRDLQAGDTFGVVESIKAVSDLYSPVTGKVIEVNAQAQQDPASLNRSAHDTWLIKLEVQNENVTDSLMDSNKYTDYVKSL